MIFKWVSLVSAAPVIDSHFAPKSLSHLPPPTFNTVIQWEKA